MSGAIRCTWGGNNVPRCDKVAATVRVIGPEGRLRPRCADHATDGWPLDPGEAAEYFKRRAKWDAMRTGQ